MSSLILDFLAATDTTDPIENEALWSGGTANSRRSATGKRITPAIAMQVSAYFACIRNISEDIGKLPFNLRQGSPTGRSTKLIGDPLFQVLRVSPNPETTPMVFWETITQWAAAWGNA